MWLFHRDEFPVLKDGLVTPLAHGGLIDAWPLHLTFSLIVFDYFLARVGLLCDTDLEGLLPV